MDQRFESKEKKAKLSRENHLSHVPLKQVFVIVIQKEDLAATYGGSEVTPSNNFKHVLLADALPLRLHSAFERVYM